MTKQVNANIGHIKCFSCDELAAVRKNRSGGLYYDCLECGRIAPNHAGGQRRIQERAVIWGANGAPSDVPAWIREQLPYAVAIRERNKPPVPDGFKEIPVAVTITTAADQDQPRAAADDLPDAPKPPRKRAPKTPPANPPKKPKETPRADPPDDDQDEKGDFWDRHGL